MFSFIKKIFNIEIIISVGNKKLGDFTKQELTYNLLNKEEESRKLILNNRNYIGEKLNFLDVGGRDGELVYLFGNKGNFEMCSKMQSINKEKFNSMYNYYGVDIEPVGDNVLFGDICSIEFQEKYRDKKGFFDVIYSNDVFEHLEKPWIAAENINFLLKQGGLAIIIAPFSLRYHAVPDDFFRYSHKAFFSLFSTYDKYCLIKTGYDIQGRRNNWQGKNTHMDLVPLDAFGAWREAWFTFTAMQKE